MNVEAVIDRSGSGMTYRVIVNDVQVWSWAWHVDGPLDPVTDSLFTALQPKAVS